MYEKKKLNHLKLKLSASCCINLTAQDASNCTRPCVFVEFEAVSAVKLLQYVIANLNLKGYIKQSLVGIDLN